MAAVAEGKASWRDKVNWRGMASSHQDRQDLQDMAVVVEDKEMEMVFPGNNSEHFRQLMVEVLLEARTVAVAADRQDASIPTLEDLLECSRRTMRCMLCHIV